MVTSFLRNSTIHVKTGILSLFALTLPSCCSLINGRTQEVKFDASPNGGELVIDGKPMGTVPQRVSLKRSKSHLVHISAPGYVPYDRTLDKSISGWFFGNALGAGIFGMAIDFCTGAAYTFDDVNVSLTPMTLNKGVSNQFESARSNKVTKKPKATKQSADTKSSTEHKTEDIPQFVMPGSSS